MIKEFIPYEQALQLKELGFDEPYYFATYLDSANLIPREEEDGWNLSKGIIAPLYQQAFRFFREKHGLHSEIEYTGLSYLGYVSGMSNNIFNTYEEAELACLISLIKIAKQQNNETTAIDWLVKEIEAKKQNNEQP